MCKCGEGGGGEIGICMGGGGVLVLWYSGGTIVEKIPHD